ncbi:hypothetical protein SAMN00017405_0955 [Desulfonispora thiosulfatigenes DSM 11270]|uniref:DUF6431 domain-containing protein n=1 Tax=Desulfonispora thiosulfatigenes DSM 11270 TaxID=656914 RepID=A0A1W1UNJ4_DESTI|nr:DUF6431 domain-containing protein [Desulfonispora thiosulfatigenes]SMB82695.1 hypothetical protein SAMN00017405_0955 [Desulfonispora thiosulfatigenes DSM 11270]
MQKIYDFKISPFIYEKLGVENKFPVLNTCPACKANVILKRHGFYYRNIYLLKRNLRIPICRYYCPSCQKTTSLLPIFLIPYYQLPLKLIFTAIKEKILHGKNIFSLVRQHLSFLKKRFFKNLNIMEAFFRDLKFKDFIPKDINKKAMKIVKMIWVSPEETFSRKFFHHFSRSFMTP